MGYSFLPSFLLSLSSFPFSLPFLLSLSSFLPSFLLSFHPSFLPSFLRFSFLPFPFSVPPRSVSYRSSPPPPLCCFTTLLLFLFDMQLPTQDFFYVTVSCLTSSFLYIQLQESGLDLTFSMRKMLLENIRDAIYESHRHHVEAIKHRVVVSFSPCALWKWVNTRFPQQKGE